jgi:hypothetical protein
MTLGATTFSGIPAAAETFDLVPGATLPLALYRERSVCREAPLAALNDNELRWEIIYTCPSFAIYEKPRPDKAAAALAAVLLTLSQGLSRPAI